MKSRERATLAAKVATPKPPPPLPVAEPPVVTAASYLEIAQKMLFAPDRNSQVILDPPKPPDPPKPIPPLPGVHGVMDLGDGPIVMMSEKQGARSRAVRPGETIGAFKLVSVDSEDLVLSWEDRTVKKKLQELIDRGVVDAAGGPGGPGGTQTNSTGAGAAPPPPAPAVAKPEPGVKLTEDTASCQTGDASPAGAVVNGMRKVVMRTPFGEACRWEAVK